MLKKLYFKITLIISIILFSQTTVLAANENATDIIVKYEGFCANYPINFVMYNQTQYDDVNKIEDNLCEDGEDPKEDRCDEWELFSGKLKIFNGPIDGLPILKEFDLKSKREFQVTFSEFNSYLISYESNDEQYNDWEELVELAECKRADKNKDKYPEVEEKTEKAKTNQTFLYNNNEFVIDIKDTSIENQNEITIQEIQNSQVENSIKTIEILTTNQQTEFSKIIIQTNINLENKEFEIKKFNENTNLWQNVNLNIIEQTQTSIKFEITSFGKYSISQKQKEVVIDNQNNIENQTNQNTQLNENQKNKNDELVPIELDLGKAKTQSQINPILIGGIVVFVLIIVGFLFIPKQRKDTDMSGYQNKPINNETYRKTKEYVQKYKTQYNQEQIKTSLIQGKIDKEIIDKVLKEEF